MPLGDIVIRILSHRQHVLMKATCDILVRSLCNTVELHYYHININAQQGSTERHSQVRFKYSTNPLPSWHSPTHTLQFRFIECLATTFLHNPG